MVNELQLQELDYISGEQGKNFLRFEFIDESGYRTTVEKKFEGQLFTDLLVKVKFCLMVCGYSEETVDEYIPYES